MQPIKASNDTNPKDDALIMASDALIDTMKCRFLLFDKEREQPHKQLEQVYVYDELNEPRCHLKEIKSLNVNILEALAVPDSIKYVQYNPIQNEKNDGEDLGWAAFCELNLELLGIPARQLLSNDPHLKNEMSQYHPDGDLAPNERSVYGCAILLYVVRIVWMFELMYISDGDLSDSQAHYCKV